MKVLFLSEAVTWSQVVRLKLLADHLDPRRFDVTFAAARFDPVLFGASTFERVHVHSLSPETVEQRTRFAQRIYDAGTLTAYVDEELALYRRIRPDVVVSDLRWSTTVSAPASKIPLVTLIDSYWFRPLTDYPIPDHPLANLIDQKALRRGFDMVLPRLLRYFAEPVNALRRRYGLSAFADLRDVLAYGTELVFPDDPLLAPANRNGTFLGPLSFSPEIPRPEWLDALGRERPAIYVTMGSSGDVSVLPKVVTALASLDADVIVASARRQLPAFSSRRVRVVDVAPGDEMARRASLVVCSGGASTAWQALASGTPVVGIPSNLDACLAMSSIARFGAGLELRANASVEQIAAACLEGLTSQTLRARAAELRASAACFSPHERFVEVLEKAAHGTKLADPLMAVSS